MGKTSASSDGQEPKESSEPIPASAAVASGTAPPGRVHGDHPHIEFKFLEELKKRNVVRVALLYLVVCWLILEPTHVVFHMLEVPAWANRLVLILMAIGLPAVVLFAWAFEITPEGLKPTVEVDPKKSIRSLTGRRLDRTIIVVLVLALSYFVVDKLWISKREAVAENNAVPRPTAQAPSAPAEVAVPEKSIAVLPFVDMSEKRDQEYFADGMAEEILELLSKVPELHVPARTSSFYFKGKQATIADIAKALNVAHLLEGSVRKSGNTLRITVQLVRADNGFHLWSEAYDRKLDDIFKVQDEIASNVVKALKVSLLRDAMPKPKGTQNLEAYTLYLQGRALIGSRAETMADYAKAADLMQQALKLDPTFALAWEWLAVARGIQAGATIPRQQGFEEARHAASRAQALDPYLSGAHSVMAWIHLRYDWDWVGTQAEVKKALELDSGNAYAWLWGGWLAQMMGHYDEALESYQRAVASDPLNALVYLRLGSLHYWMGRFAEAQAAFRNAADLDSGKGILGGGFGRGLVKLAVDDPAGALAEFEGVKDKDDRLSGQALAYHALGRKVEADLALAKYEKSYVEPDAFGIAEIYAYRGEVDRAFAWLDRAYQQRNDGLPLVRGDPLLKNLHSDPRFKAFLRKMNLPE